MLDGRSDVYSLGVTLYELLTLRPAFGGDDRAEVLRRIAQEEPRPPRRLNPAIPAAFETIVLKAMAKEPARRYASAARMADDLSGSSTTGRFWLGRSRPGPGGPSGRGAGPPWPRCSAVIVFMACAVRRRHRCLDQLARVAQRQLDQATSPGGPANPRGGPTA